MRYTRAIEKVRTLAEACTATAAIPGDHYFPLNEVYVFDELLDGPESLDWVQIALVVDLPDTEVTWGRQPDDAYAVVYPLRLDKGGFSYFWRSHEQQVANHFIREPVRIWSKEDGIDDEALEALKEKRFGDIPRPAFDKALLADELAATLKHLREVSDEYWDSKWRRAHSGNGRYPENTLRDAVFGYLDLLDADQEAGS
ncbi:hypothetical protein JGU71_19345 [Antrihabitans sp. YC3-6]|uniref:DUF7711 domain-containing protein n=1 Tax=Antrihabitans stalagmiti TaxID=2799499 RepID=A0A934NTB2_9NOCA|nr:hypothetical protein [Antrihabitans stalagmiti]MBJ8341046.1 hypothetical protein [Antrihabitans stalagmiti]